MRITHLRIILLSALFCAVAAPGASASTTVIDLRDDAITTFVSSFGVPNTTTYGQVITAPAGVQTINSFSFRIENQTSTVLFRGEIYAWNGTNATGPALFESQPTSVSGTALQDVTFDTGTTALTPGSQYVLFVSASKEFEVSSGVASGRFRSVPNATYAGGNFVFLNNGTDETQWTSLAWSSISVDLQFRARFVTAPQSLTVAKSGTGKGTVTGTGIDCGTDCTENFSDKTLVVLQAVGNTGSVFAGFSGGGCSISPCLLTMDDAKTVTAQFTDNKAPQTTVSKLRSSKIKFKSSEAGSTFKCTLDRGKARKCKSPFKTKNLKSGSHLLKVAATDAAGNKDKSPAKLRFTVD